MVFNSITFLIFFLTFFYAYWAINNKGSNAIRNLFIIVSSYVFYGWWDWRFLSLIVISSAADYFIGLSLSKAHIESRRKALLIISVIVNVGILGFFKYFNFFIESLNDFFSLFSVKISLTTLKIILPVGISFYTFQTLSYTIDIYKRKLKPTRDIISFFAFVSFFPQLVAGPIERARHLLPQFTVKKVFNYHVCVEGLRLLLWGFFKKVVIADNFGIFVDDIFQTGISLSGLSVLIGALFFAIQIYADFSGYSDIAIGISRMLGFDLMTNFKTPYFASSFSDFWRRWHISLSTWFRDYVYISLGGNKRGGIRIKINILITFLLSGLWHGANFTFLIWGGLHGLVLIIEKRVKLRLNKTIYAPFVLIVVILLWMPFRAENIDHLMDIGKSLALLKTYTLDHITQVVVGYSKVKFIMLIIIAILFFLVERNMKLHDFNEWIIQKSKYTRIALYYLIILIILLMINFSVKPSFIYFQF